MAEFKVTGEYYSIPGYEVPEFNDNYEILIDPNGEKLTILTEPEDRTFFRDLGPVVRELNRLFAQNREKNAKKENN